MSLTLLTALSANEGASWLVCGCRLPCRTNALGTETATVRPANARLATHTLAVNIDPQIIVQATAGYRGQRVKTPWL